MDKIAVYTDYAYSRANGTLYAERAFAVFLSRLASRAPLVLVGRVSPNGERARYAIPADVEFAGLPYYESLHRPTSVLRASGKSLRRFWRAIDGVDTVWLLGPHPLALAFAALALLRRRKVVLGVRQEMPAYVRSRHPGRRVLHLVADALDRAYAALARRCPIVVVGPALRRRYPRAASIHDLTVSLVEPGDVATAEAALARRYDGELTILSVGRLEEEKNPLILADVMAALCAAGDPRWRLVVCGEGSMGPALMERARELGVAERTELRGYVPIGSGMWDAYRGAHFLLHTSWTEGLPQVLIEACAAGLPVVATDVGGIGEAVGDAAVTVPPGDAEAAARALHALAGDARARERLIGEALAFAGAHTIESEVDRLAGFLET